MNSRFHLLSLGALIWLASTTPLEAASHKVPQDSATIQGAINRAKDGDEIIVSPGTYRETVDFMGKGLSLRSLKGPRSTTIDGQGGAPVVLIDGGNGKSAELVGFTVANGSGSGTYTGGGIKCAGRNPHIRNNIIRNNRADRGAGILMVDQFDRPCNARVRDNVIENNSARDIGGGISAVLSNPGIENNVIRFNSARGGYLDPSKGPAGGGIYLNSVRGAVVDGNVIYSNSAEHAGGGLMAIESTAVIRNNSILRNSSRFGAGVHLEANESNGVAAAIEFLNNAVAQNTGRNMRETDTTEVMGAGLGSFGSDLLVRGNRFLYNENASGAACNFQNNLGKCAFGGGVAIFADGKSVSATLEANVFVANKSEFGGGAWLAGVGLTVESSRNHYFLNKADSRPGLGCQRGADCSISGDVYQRNSLKAGAPVGVPTTNGAGGVDFFDATGHLSNSVIWGNQGQLGAVRIGRSHVDVVNNLLLDNDSLGDSGGLVLGDNGASMEISPAVVNNQFVDNDELQITELGGVMAMLENNLFYPARSSMFSDWESGPNSKVRDQIRRLNDLPEARDNIAIHPDWVAGAERALCRDFHLASGSPAIDQGAPGYVDLDVEGDGRNVDGAPDIGVDEFVPGQEKSCQGITRLGIYDPVEGVFHLDADNRGGRLETTVTAPGNGLPLVGDVNGDGVGDFGVFEEASATFVFDTNGDGSEDFRRGFGKQGDLPVIGDWDGDGTDDIGVYRSTMGVFFLDIDGQGQADRIFQFGPAKSLPVAGDWDGDGRDEVAVYKQPSRTFYLNMSMTDKAVVRQFRYGAPNIDLPVVGDWNGDGVDEIGLYRDDWRTFFQDGGDALVNERQVSVDTPKQKLPVTGVW